MGLREEMKTNWKETETKVRGQVCNQIGDQVKWQVWWQVRIQVWDQINKDKQMCKKPKQNFLHIALLRFLRKNNLDFIKT
jgi:hypothetical protein